MAPHILSEEFLVPSTPITSGIHVKHEGYPREPLKLSGALDEFEFEDATPVIGREYINVNIVDDLLNAPNADARIRDLAIISKHEMAQCSSLEHAKRTILVARRGVVFFRAQNNLTNDQQKRFIQRLGELSGKPMDSTLHIHPVLNNTSEFGVGDAQISHISSLARKKLFRHELQADKRHYDTARWHSDIQFEVKPADYTSLRLTQLPKTGGDTLWASGYEIYDRFSKPYQKFFEGLTATYIGLGFLNAAKADPENVIVHEGPRGAPENVGKELATVHPVVSLDVLKNS